MQTTDVIQFKCPNCGSVISYDPSSSNLKCPYCDSKFELKDVSDSIENISTTDEFGWDGNSDEFIDVNGQKTYVCPSCGGTLSGDESLAASISPYCGNGIIVSKQFEGMLKPDLVIPFEYNKSQAKEAFKNYLKGKKLLAGDFASSVVIDKISGMYVPYWLFSNDASCQARYNATRSHHYIEGDYEVTSTDHYLVYRDGQISFDDIPVDASKKLSAELMESLEPFDSKKGVDFNVAYLSGFFADKYEEDSNELISRANQRIKTSTLDALSGTVIGYSTVMLSSSNISFSNGKIKYALYPIYLVSTTYKGQTYTFAMNGQTGKFSGNLPYDSFKATYYFIISFIIVTAVVFAIMCFLR